MTKEARLFWKSAKTSTSPKRNRPKKNPALSAVNRMFVFDSKNRRRLGTASTYQSLLVKFMRFGETFALSIEEQIAFATLSMDSFIPHAPEITGHSLPERRGLQFE